MLHHGQRIHVFMHVFMHALTRCNTAQCSMRYAVNKHHTLGVTVFNIAGSTSNGIEYLYTGCTASEVASSRL